MTRPTVIAFHGWRGSGEMLRRDINVPGMIDIYHDGHDLQAARQLCGQHESVLLIGYSLGGALIADLSCLIQNIRAAVLYESPLGRQGRVGGNFPVLIIWNKQGRINWPKARRMRKVWQESGRECSFLEGNGPHIGRDQDGDRCHGWDQTINAEIFGWVSEQLENSGPG